MKLYKYIGFDKSYCGYIANENKIRFATIKELQSGNDNVELTYCLNTKASVLNEFEDRFKITEIYKIGFESTAVLSMALCKNQDLWKEYCSSGGLIYEFEFDPKKITDINHRRVMYSNDKIYNLWRYLIKNETDSKYKKILRYEGGITDYDRSLFKIWFKKREKNFITHVLNEIVYKKSHEYSFENEYRFSHLLKPIGDVKELKINLIDQKANLNQMGLTLQAIHTNDISYATRILSTSNTPLFSIDF